MKHLFAQWDTLEKFIANKFVILFLDYDGTLTPIAKSPDKAFIPERTKELLKGLARNRKCILTIISGRGLKDIKKKIGLKNIVYSGNHGLEIQSPKISFKFPLSASYKAALNRIKNRLNKRLSSIKGILLEDKGLSLSLHYRLVNQKQIPFVLTAFRKIVAPYLQSNKIKIRTGKKVFEVRPAVEWDKGKVILWLLNKHKSTLCHKPIMPVYIGDDVTDEDAFKALKNKGLTIFVGNPKKSHAKYYLKNTREVFEFLKRLILLLSMGIPRL